MTEPTIENPEEAAVLQTAAEAEPEGLPLADEQPQLEEQVDELESEPPIPSEESAGTEQQARQAADMLQVGLPTPTKGGAPSWVKLPVGFKFPRGKQVIFMKFRSSWTDAPWIGETMIDDKTGKPFADQYGKPMLFRQCVIWPINVNDKKLALNRAMRDPNRASDELAKQMIRVHDGIECDWGTVTNDGIEMYWNQLGEKCRSLLFRIFSQLHVLDSEGTRDFLTNCIEVRTTGS